MNDEMETSVACDTPCDRCCFIGDDRSCMLSRRDGYCRRLGQLSAGVGQDKKIEVVGHRQMPWQTKAPNMEARDRLDARALDAAGCIQTCALTTMAS